MRVFIAGVTGDPQHVKGLRSLFEIARRPDDGFFLMRSIGTGYSTRAEMVETFMQRREYEALLMLDADQAHPPYLLDKLRVHLEEGKDMACAHYYSRSTKPVQSLCFALGDGTWPFLPLLDPPTEGLHEIAMTGLGCVLIHRRVIEAVYKHLGPNGNPMLQK